jgi:LuxR family maltose regulon positive regulatory protein
MAIDCMIGLALTHEAMGQSRKAAETMDQLLEFVRETRSPEHLAVAHSGQARLALARGDLDSAAQWARSLGDGPEIRWNLIWLEVPALTHARVLVALGDDRSLSQAIAHLKSLRRLNEARHNTCQNIDILALMAVALQKSGRLVEASECLVHLLTLTEPGGWIQPFVELGQPMADLLTSLREKKASVTQIDRILSVFRKEEVKAGRLQPLTRAPEQSLIESLTHREIDTLELLAKRLYDKEIAEALSVSSATVRTHLQHIYQKLQVGNRRQAIIKAEELGLIGNARRK